jgi:hypothetical protein
VGGSADADATAATDAEVEALAARLVAGTGAVAATDATTDAVAVGLGPTDALGAGFDRTVRASGAPANPARSSNETKPTT